MNTHTVVISSLYRIAPKNSKRGTSLNTCINDGTCTCASPSIKIHVLLHEYTNVVLHSIGVWICSVHILSPPPRSQPPNPLPSFSVHTYSSPGEGPLYLIKFLHWTPALSNEATLSHIKVEHVHNVVDGLDLLNLSNQKIHAYYVHENEYMYMQDTVFRVIFVFQEKLFGELNIITMNSLSCSQAACNSICTIRNTGYSGIN